MLSFKLLAGEEREKVFSRGLPIGSQNLAKMRDFSSPTVSLKSALFHKNNHY